METHEEATADKKEADKKRVSNQSNTATGGVCNDLKLVLMRCVCGVFGVSAVEKYQCVWVCNIIPAYHSNYMQLRMIVMQTRWGRRWKFFSSVLRLQSLT